jgi:hypothetical protein
MKSWVALAALVGGLSAFSGCKFESQYTDKKLQRAVQSAELAKVSPCTTPWGEEVLPGAEVVAYRAQTSCRSTCDSQVRVCENGVLTGSNEFQYRSCTPNICHSCVLPWGGILTHGSPSKAYLASEVSCGGSCTANGNELPVQCDDGTLVLQEGGTPLDLKKTWSGSCSVAGCPCPLPWDSKSTFPSGSQVTAFESPQVGCGQSCTQKIVACDNGRWRDSSGLEISPQANAFRSASCQAVCAGCSFEGQSYVSGQSISAYPWASADPALNQSCEKRTITCSDGNWLPGGVPSSVCVRQCQLNGVSYPAGSTQTFYLANKHCPAKTPLSSLTQQVVCDGATGQFKTPGGVPVAAPLFASVSQECASCSLKHTDTGSEITIDGNGGVVTAFQKAEIGCGKQACEPQLRTCVDGVLSGTFTNSQCRSTCQGCYFAQEPPSEWNDSHPQADVASGRKTGFTQALLAPGQSCASSGREYECKNGLWYECAGGSCTKDVAFLRLAPTCQTRCSLSTPGEGSGSEEITLLPNTAAAPYTFFTAQSQSCSQGSVETAVAAWCDGTTGTLRSVSGGVLPSPLYPSAGDAACRNCTLPAPLPDGSQTIFDGGSAGPFFEVAVGGCGDQACSAKQVIYSCRAGVVTREDGTPATLQDYQRYTQASCSNECADCVVPLQGQAPMNLAIGESIKLSDTDAVTECSDSCASHEATVTCGSGKKLSITGAANKSLNLIDLRYSTCETRARCDSGGNPPAACAMPGWFSDFSQWSTVSGNDSTASSSRNVLSRPAGGSEMAYYQSRYNTDVSGGNLGIIHDFGPGRPMNSFLVNFSDPVSRKTTKYRRHESGVEGTAYWWYQVSADTTQTFYDVPLVDQSIAGSEADHCDFHAEVKRCDPDGYWLLANHEKPGDRGGRGPLFESERSRRYQYSSCVTLPKSYDWQAKKQKNRSDCLSRSGPGACLFEKNPAVAQGGAIPSRTADLSALQTLSIDVDLSTEGLAFNESFRGREVTPLKLSYCAAWEYDLTGTTVNEVLKDRDWKQKGIASGKIRYNGVNKLYTAVYGNEELDPSKWGWETPLNRSGVGRRHRIAYSESPPLPEVETGICRRFNSLGQCVGWISKATPRSNLAPTRVYPALRTALYYSLWDFQETLRQKFGFESTGFAYRGFEVLEGWPLTANNAYFTPWMPGFRPELRFGPALSLSYECDAELGCFVVEEMGPSLSIDRSIQAHELGHANLFYLAGHTGVSDSNETVTPQGSHGCKTPDGCLGAIHEGQADYLASMFFPSHPAVGDGVVGSSMSTPGQGLCSCGICRNPATNARPETYLTFEAAYNNACGESAEGEIHLMGAAYASLWWKVRSDAALTDEVDRLFLAHLKYLPQNVTFIDTVDAVAAADSELRSRGLISRSYTGAYEQELNRRLGGGRTLASRSSIPTITQLASLKASKSRLEPVVVRFEVSDAVFPAASLMVSASALEGAGSVAPRFVLARAAETSDRSGSNDGRHREVVVASNGEVGKSTIRVKVTNGAGGSATQSFEIEWLVQPAEPVASSGSPESEGAAGSESVSATSGSTAPAGSGSVATTEYPLPPICDPHCSVPAKLAFLKGVPLKALFPDSSEVRVVGGSAHGIILGSPPVYFPDIGFTGLERLQVEVVEQQETQRFTIPLDFTNPIPIQTLVEFEKVRKIPFGNFALMKDLDFAGVDFQPIGSRTNPFIGDFSGNNWTLKNIRLVGQSTDVFGVFGLVSGNITYLNLDHLTVAGNGQAVGGVFGSISASGVASMVNVTHGEVAGGYYQGGVAGVIQGSLKQSSFSGRLLPLAYERTDRTLYFPVRDLESAKAGGIAGEFGFNMAPNQKPARRSSGEELPFDQAYMNSTILFHAASTQLSSDMLKVFPLGVPRDDSSAEAILFKLLRLPILSAYGISSSEVGMPMWLGSIDGDSVSCGGRACADPRDWIYQDLCKNIFSEVRNRSFTLTGEVSNTGGVFRLPIPTELLEVQPPGGGWKGGGLVGKNDRPAGKAIGFNTSDTSVLLVAPRSRGMTSEIASAQHVDQAPPAPTTGAAPASVNVQYSDQSSITLTVGLYSQANPSFPLTEATIEPSLPAGLSLSSAGVIYGVPSAISADSEYRIRGQQANGSPAELLLRLRVNDVAPSNFRYSKINPLFFVGRPIAEMRPLATGGAIERYSITPALPAGLVLDETTGVISGTPSVEHSSSDFVITATNSGGTSSTTLNIQVHEPRPIEITNAQVLLPTPRSSGNCRLVFPQGRGAFLMPAVAHEAEAVPSDAEGVRPPLNPSQANRVASCEERNYGFAAPEYFPAIATADILAQRQDSSVLQIDLKDFPAATSELSGVSRLVAYGEDRLVRVFIGTTTSSTAEVLGFAPADAPTVDCDGGAP